MERTSTWKGKDDHMKGINMEMRVFFWCEVILLSEGFLLCHQCAMERTSTWKGKDDHMKGIEGDFLLLLLRYMLFWKDCDTSFENLFLEQKLGCFSSY
jgi:hypothetical protein